MDQYCGLEARVSILFSFTTSSTQPLRVSRVSSNKGISRLREIRYLVSYKITSVSHYSF